MTWIDDNCQGNRRCQCTYLTFDTWQQFCVDEDEGCQTYYDNAGLVAAQCGGGGGGW